MTKGINEREIVLAILMEVTENGAYSHIVLREVLEKYQYLEKRERAFITRVTEGTLEQVFQSKSEEDEACHPQYLKECGVSAEIYGFGSGQSGVQRGREPCGEERIFGSEGLCERRAQEHGEGDGSGRVPRKRGESALGEIFLSGVDH